MLYWELCRERSIAVLLKEAFGFCELNCAMSFGYRVLVERLVGLDIGFVLALSFGHTYRGL